MLNRSRLGSRFAGEQLLERPQHQREWCAELVADVAEERGLRAVEFGQGLGAPALVLVGLGVGDRRRDLTCHEIEKRLVGLIEGALRIDAHHQLAGQPATRTRERQFLHLPGLGGQQRGLRIGRARLQLIVEIGQRKRHIDGPGGQRVSIASTQVSRGVRAATFE